MAVVFMEGFDTYNGLISSGTNLGADVLWQFPNLTNTFTGLVAGRYGGQASFSSIYATTYWSGFFSTPVSQFVCGHSFYQNNLLLPVATINPYICFLSNDTSMLGLKVNIDGSISACRITSLSAGTVLGTSAAGVIKSATWHSIEFACSISDTVGTVDIVVDGVNVLSLTGQDTRNGTPTTINRIIMGGNNGTYNSVTRIDDLYITDSLTLLGPMRIETLYPNADTAQKQWIPSTGSTNYTTIDETLLSSSDYVYSNTVGNFDLYDFGNLSTTPTSISAVQVVPVAQKDDVGLRAIASTVKSGSSTTDSANFYLGSSWNLVPRIMNTDPNTSTAWTASAVNSIQAGPKVTI